MSLPSVLKRFSSLVLLSSVAAGLTACAPEVGSPDWCKKIESKPTGEITMNEAKDYAKHCVFK